MSVTAAPRARRRRRDATATDRPGAPAPAPSAPPPRGCGAPRTATAFGVAVACVGAAVLVGWLTGTPVLLRAGDRQTPMVVNSALGFLLAGAGAVAAARGHLRLAAFGGAFVALLGIAGLVQELAGLDLGIDQWLFEQE